jgi:outer membrane protein OmpA-like peptidoglycan-associated protein
MLSTAFFSQTKKLDTVFCDCNQAKIITVNSKTIYGKTISPKGFGKEKEISPTKQHTSFAFDNEHNSAWYKLIINESGELALDIIPIKPDDDYDFMLFKSSKNNFCDSLKRNKINPIRACISRDKEELNGKTGLNYKSTSEFVKHGVGEAYCKSLNVKKGEVYYLVLDNVYEKGDGHKIEFEITQSVLFNGFITDENNNPIITDIALTNQIGDTISLEKTNDDGRYSFTAQLIKNQSYDINFYNDSSFSFSKKVTCADTAQLKTLAIILPRLKKGNKHSVGSINFIGNSVEYLPRAIPAMHNLFKLLKKNPNLRIRIIGHSNGRTTMDEYGIIAFTKGRATSVKKFLTDKGIDEHRIEVSGRGDHEMIYKSFKRTEAQSEENRRVEILVLEF